MTENTTARTLLRVRVDRTDGTEPVRLPFNTQYSGGWEPAKAARATNDDARRMHGYDGTIRVRVWTADDDGTHPDDAQAPDDAQVFDFPAGSLAAERELQQRRNAAYQRLRKLTKAQLCARLRANGLVWSFAPPERWTKEEVLSSVIDQEASRD